MASIDTRSDGRCQARWRAGPQKTRHFDRKGSVEFVYRWVATIFKVAVGDRLIAASPCIRIALPNKLDTQ
jgi:hypothetical protein